MNDAEFDARFDMLTLDEIWERVRKRFDVGLLVAQKDLDTQREDIRFYIKGGVLCLALAEYAKLRLCFLEERRFIMKTEQMIEDDAEEEED